MKLNQVGFFGLAISLSFTLVACGPAPNPVTQPSSTTPTSTPDPIPTAPPFPSGSPDQGNPNAQPIPTPTPSVVSGGSGAGTGNGTTPENPNSGEIPADIIATAISLHTPSNYINISNSYQLTADVLKGLEKLTGIKLEWTSSKPGLIHVDETGRVTALSDSGLSVITAKIPNTDISASVTLELRSAGSGGGGGGGSVVTPPDPGTPQPTPVITGLNPDPVDIGASLTITGTDFLASSTVTIGGVAATITSQTPTQLVVTVPTSLSSGSTNVVVSNNTLTATLAVTVNVPLVISSFAPQQGISGTNVVLTGRKFTGATAVTFNGVAAAAFTVDSDTQITAKVPFGAATDGKINVVVPTENADSSTDFDVTGRVFLVRQGATGTNDSSSWTNARTSLYDVLNASQAGDEIWVAAGTYKPLTGVETSSANRSRTFQLKAGVGIYGSFAGTESTRAARVLPNSPSSTLSGDHDSTADDYSSGILNTTGTSNNAYHVVTGAAGVNDATRPVLDGFAIVGGHAANNGGGMYNDNLGNFGPSLSNLYFNNNQVARPGTGTGGGIYNNASNLRLSRVKFEFNAAPNGGAIHDSAGNSSYSQIEFSANEVVGVQNQPISSLGGAIYSTNGNTSNFERVFFVDNFGWGGGAIAIINSSPRFANAVFYNNGATTNGAAFYISGTSNPQLIYASLFSNFGSGGSTAGGSIYQETGTTPGLLMVNSLLTSSEALNGYTITTGQGNVTGFNQSRFACQNARGQDFRPFTADDGFRLQSTATTALDQGLMSYTGVTMPGTDMLGNARPSGLAPDAGAYEGVFPAGCTTPL